MVNDRFDTMVKNNSGGLLCFANFFKTNTDRNVEINYICHRLSTKTNVTGIIFEIHLDSTKRSTRSPFASFDEIYLSEITEKNGIFFSMFTVFRIESIEENRKLSFLQIFSFIIKQCVYIYITSSLTFGRLYTKDNQITT